MRPSLRTSSPIRREITKAAMGRSSQWNKRAYPMASVGAINKNTTRAKTQSPR